MFEFRRTRERLPVVLLIDDDLVSREVTATVLTMSGYTVHTARRRRVALEMLQRPKDFSARRHPDGRADARPERNAVDRGSSARAAAARIYAISGSNPPADVAAAADGFLLKPFNAEAFASCSKGAV